MQALIHRSLSITVADYYRSFLSIMTNGGSIGIMEGFYESLIRMFVHYEPFVDLVYL